MDDRRFAGHIRIKLGHYREVRILNNVIVGYTGHPQMHGGLDTRALGFGDDYNATEDHGHAEHKAEGKFFAVVQNGYEHSE